jgi:hypothetical protein
MTENRYSMSFTAGALLHQESLTVADLFEELGDWGRVRERVRRTVRHFGDEDE